VAVQLLYAPLPDLVRDGARRTVDGFLKKGGMGVAGVLLLGIARAVGVQGAFALTLAGCGALVFVLARLRWRYVEAVHERVAGVEPGAIKDAEERVLLEALKAPSVERASRAAELLESEGLVRERHVRAMLAHPSERLQERGVTLALELRLSGLAKPLEALVSAGARRPRDAAIWALARLHPERALAVLPPLLNESDPGVLATAVGGLLILPGPPDGRALATLETSGGARGRAAGGGAAARAAGARGGRPGAAELPGGRRPFGATGGVGRGRGRGLHRARPQAAALSRLARRAPRGARGVGRAGGRRGAPLGGHAG
jgi:hypothetical protein